MSHVFNMTLCHCMSVMYSSVSPPFLVLSWNAG